MSSLRAFIKTLEIYKNENVCKHLWEYGEKLKNIFHRNIIDFGLEKNFKLEGLPILMNYLTIDSEGKNNFKLRTLFNQEMIKNGVFMPWISQSFSHGEKELRLTEKALQKTFSIFSKGLKYNIDDFLDSKEIIKPVFRKYN